MFILAIKGLHVTPDADIQDEARLKLCDIVSEEDIIPMNDSNFEYLGVFSKEGDMHLFDKDVKLAIKMFKEMIHFRLLHENQIHL